MGYCTGDNVVGIYKPWDGREESEDKAMESWDGMAPGKTDFEWIVQDQPGRKETWRGYLTRWTSRVGSHALDCIFHAVAPCSSVAVGFHRKLRIPASVDMKSEDMDFAQCLAQRNEYLGHLEILTMGDSSTQLLV